MSDSASSADKSRRARSFDAWADQYDRFRPSYPAALFDHIAARLGLGPDLSVADLGAGTGKAAIAMARRGWRVTAVEPGGPMLDVLRSHAAGEGLAIAVMQASAESTGLPDASVDLATAAQAYHWFDHVRAVAEMARIVRPGGGLAVFWNTRDDDRSPLLKAYSDLLEQTVPEEQLDRRVRRDEVKTRAELTGEGWFEVDGRVEIPHEMPMDHADFLGLAFTTSYVQLLDEPARARFRDELQELLRIHAPEGRMLIPYKVDLYVGRRTDRAA